MAPLATMIREGFSEKVEFELRSDEGLNPLRHWERALQPKEQLVQRP